MNPTQPNRIMVVDDEAVIITQMEEMLTSLGYDVVGKTSTGRSAIQLAKELTPDLVLMDIVMPGDMDGIAACGVIQEELDIPVILLTAYGDDTHVARAKTVHPYGYILKPSQNDQIKAAIEIALEKKSMERNLDDMLVGLRTQAEDRELQLKEIHHRIKNNLNMICGLLALQSMHMEDSGCSEALKAVRSRVISIAKVHEKLYSSDHLDTIKASEYFESLADSLRRSYVFPENVEFQIDCEAIELEPDKLMPVGLMVTEFLTNCLKYAFPNGGPGFIRVSFTPTATHYVLEVADSGVGLPPDVIVTNPQTLGLELVRGLVTQVGGEFEHDTEVEQGTTFRVRIPV